MDAARRGYVLIAVLVALAIAGALGGSYALATRRALENSRAEIDRAQAQALARGGAIQASKNLAIALGTKGLVGADGRALAGARGAAVEIPGLPAFPPEMANAGGFLGQIAKRLQEIEQQKAQSQGRELEERAGGKTPDGGPGDEEQGPGVTPPRPRAPLVGLGPMSLTLDGQRVEVALENERGKIDVNSMPRWMLHALLVGVGESPASAETLLDSIERYKVALAGPGAADARFASVAFRERPLRGDRLDRLERLLAVEGMTPALYVRLSAHLTASDGRLVDPNYATEEVWRSLGVRDDSALTRLAEARRALFILDRAAISNILGPGLAQDIERWLESGQTPLFTVRCQAKSGGAVGRHMVRLEIGEGGAPRVAESREGWM